MLDVTGQGQDVQAVIHDDASFVMRQRQNETFVESSGHVGMRFGSVPGMNVHGHGEQLF